MAEEAHLGVSDSAEERAQLSDSDCNIEINISRLRSLPLEDLVNGDVRKRHANFRTPRRKHHEHKVQKLSSRTIASLNLEPLKEPLSVGIVRRASDVYSLDSICMSSRRFDPPSSRENMLVLSGRSSSSAASEDVETNKVSRSTTIQNALYNGPRMVERNSARLSNDNASDMTNSLMCSPEATFSFNESVDVAEIDELVNGIELVSSVQTTAGVSHNGAWSINSEQYDPIYVESDCEAYCTTEDKESPELEQHMSSSSYDQDVADELDMAMVLSSFNDGTTESENYFSYSPSAQFGVLRLFFQKEKPRSRASRSRTINKRVVVNKSPFLIGSDSCCDLLFEREKCKNILSKHCKILFTECETQDEELEKLGIEAYRVELLKGHSSALIFVNNIRVRNKVQLNNGDVISLGPKKSPINVTVAFRTREACIALLDQLDSLMLSPMDSQETNTPENPANCEIPEIIEPITHQETANIDLEFNVNISVFELYYGTPQLDIGNSSFSYINAVNSPCQNNERNINKDSDSAGLTPLIDRVNKITVNHQKTKESNSDSSSQDSRSTRSPLRMHLKNCSISSTDIISHHYAEDTSMTSKLLLCTYTTGLGSVNLDDLETKHSSYHGNNKDDTFRRLEAYKIAKLRALNRHSFPIIVNSSRSHSSDQDSGRLSEQKMRFLGTIQVTYQSTLHELLGPLRRLLNCDIEEHSEDQNCALPFDIILKKTESPLTDQEYRYNWVFQLDFFDKDDSCFRRAVYNSQRSFESDKEKLRANVTEIMQQLNRSRVLYIQSK